MDNNKQKKIESAINTRKYKYAELRFQLNEEGIRHRYLLRSKKIKNVRNSIIVSIVSIFICMASLSLTTYAWFTDTVSNTNNRIQAGTLKVGLFTEGDNSEVIDLSGSNTLFNIGDLSPANKTIEKKIVVGNKGDLAIKYKLYFNVTTSGDNDLSKYLKVSVSKDSNTNYGYKGLLAGLNEASPLVSDNLEKGEKGIYYIKLELADDAPSSSTTSFDIRVQATQYTAEEDGFSNKGYDAEAKYPCENGEGTSGGCTLCDEGYESIEGYCVPDLPEATSQPEIEPLPESSDV